MITFDPVRNLSSTLVIAVGIALAISAASPVFGQSNTLIDIATYQGPDRTARLIEGAKREGVLTFYSNAPTEDNAALIAAFEKSYGIKVRLWRASSEDVRNRAITEARAKRYVADFFLNNGPALEANHEEQLLQEVKSPHLVDIIPQAMPSHREWVGFCLNVLVAAYNTNLVKAADLPKTYQDLVDPKWKGRLGIENDDSDWFAGLLQSLGEENGIKLFRDIATTNGFSVRKGHTLLTNLVSAGEVPLALTVFSYTAEQLKKKGAPLNWFVIPPLISMPNSIAVAKMAPHPHAAVLFFDFMLSDAQKLLAERDYVVTNTKFASALDRKALIVIDSSKALQNGEKWQRLYTDVLSSRK
jgi:iron(III) transport system substrate-binding protein